MNTQPGSRIYFLDNFADDGAPCAPTLEGWAAWLARPGESEARSVPADGAVFGGMALLFEDDVVMTKVNDDWCFSREPEPGRFLAVRRGPGQGWGEEDIVSGGTGERGTDLLRAWADDLAFESEDDEPWSETVACAVIESGWRFTYRAGPVPRLEAERVQ